MERVLKPNGKLIINAPLMPMKKKKNLPLIIIGLNSHNKCNTPKSVKGYTRTLLTDEKKAVRRVHRAVADGSLYRYLRHQGKKCRKRYGQNDYLGRIPQSG